MSRQLIARTLLTFVFATIGFTSQMAHADHKGIDFKRFEQEIRNSQSTCQTGVECRPEGYDFSLLYAANQPGSQIAPLLPHFQLIAKDQANIWGDTILEGEMDTDGQTLLEKVEGVYSDNQLIAYRITYSEKAWTLGDNGQPVDGGRISESTFVSVAMTSWFRDNWALAAFK
jgi:hypothetical protein